MDGGRVSRFGAALEAGGGVLARGGGAGAGRETARGAGRETGAFTRGGGLTDRGRLTGAFTFGTDRVTGVAGRRGVGVETESGRGRRRPGGRVSRLGVTRVSGVLGVSVREGVRGVGVAVAGREICGRSVRSGRTPPRPVGPPTRPVSRRRSTRRSPGVRSGCGVTVRGPEGGVAVAGVKGGVPRNAGGRLPT